MTTFHNCVLILVTMLVTIIITIYLALPHPLPFFYVVDTTVTSSLGAAEPLHVGEIAAGSFGLVLFRALGGRFSSVAPSALHMPGAFSRRGRYFVTVDVRVLRALLLSNPVLILAFYFYFSRLFFLLAV